MNTKGSYNDCNKFIAKLVNSVQFEKKNNDNYISLDNKQFEGFVRTSKIFCYHNNYGDVQSSKSKICMFC